MKGEGFDGNKTLNLGKLCRKRLKMNPKQKTYMAKKQDVKRQWLLINAEGKTLGRLASEIAKILRGKHKPDYTPHADTGDGVIVINADKVVVTGTKEANKLYRYHTRHPGGLREITYRTMMERKPTYPLEHAVKKMLPRKSRLTRLQMTRLRLYVGSNHDLAAQQPIEVEI